MDARDQATRQNLEEHLTTTRTMPRLAMLGAALVLFAAACSQGGAASSAPTAGPAGPATWTPPADLLAAAKAEGLLTTIALPKAGWCNYAEMPRPASR